jgi:hypothetical protein
VTSIEHYAILKEYDDVFREILGFPQKRDIDFSIDLTCGVAPVSNTP